MTRRSGAKTRLNSGISLPAFLFRLRWKCINNNTLHRPERWETEPAAASGMPGVWGHLMTFIGGPRACIGYRFSIVEYVCLLPFFIIRLLILSMNRMKALLFALVRAFEFELAVPAEDLIKRTGVVQRPLVRTEMSKGTQLPLIVKAYHHQ